MSKKLFNKLKGKSIDGIFRFVRPDSVLLVIEFTDKSCLKLRSDGRMGYNYLPDVKNQDKCFIGGIQDD